MRKLKAQHLQEDSRRKRLRIRFKKNDGPFDPSLSILSALEMLLEAGSQAVHHWNPRREHVQGHTCAIGICRTPLESWSMYDDVT